jgi:hypothetical protein
MKHILGFTRSQWMPPWGECLQRIASVATMDNTFVKTKENANKTQLLANNYNTFRSLVVYENISSYQMLSLDNNWKSY